MVKRYIFNADDFGPIDFINEGVYKGVAAGVINSVQVLVNGDTGASLKQKLVKLQAKVPKNKVLDIGVHLTLTSGEPLYGREDNTTRELWGEMLVRSKKKNYFRDFNKFNLDYVNYIDVIRTEFEMQRDRLRAVMNEIAAPNMVFSSISNHHNITSITPDLYELYLQIANDPAYPLNVRAPKALPRNETKLYYGFVLSFFNLSDRHNDRRRIEALASAFLDNKYTGTASLELKSPDYVDIGYYKKLGSIPLLGKARTKKESKEIADRVEEFRAMIARALDYTDGDGKIPEKQVAELIFHLGDGDPDADYKELVKDYPGVTHRYFDNRRYELLALLELPNHSELNDAAFRNMGGWSDCRAITYTKI
jgi:predicted glycoside hydrolase/deacetylase ChbG (UPF0249 family)